MNYRLLAMDNPKGTFPFDQEKYIPLGYNIEIEKRIQNLVDINIRDILQKNSLDHDINFWSKMDWERCVLQFSSLYNLLIDRLPTNPQIVDLVNYIGSFIMLLKVAQNWSYYNIERTPYIILICW